MPEIVFTVEEAAEGGCTARALGRSTFTGAGSLPESREAVRDVVRCHFGKETRPGVIRLRFVDGEVVRA